MVYRLYATTTDVKSTIKQARGHLADALANKTLGAWVKSGDYGFAILAERREKCDDLRRELDQSAGNEPSLSSQARFLVGLGLSPHTLAEALKRRKQTEPSP